LGVERSQGGGGVAGELVAFAEYPIRGITDCFATGGGHINGRGFRMIDITDRVGVISGPRIVHGGGEVEEISRMYRRIGEIDADGGKDLFVPDARDAGRAGSARGKPKLQTSNKIIRRNLMVYSV